MQGDVCPIEWKRFRQYAKRVRSLRHHHQDAIDPSVLSFLSYYQQGGPILPQLRKLHWVQRSGDDVTVFPLVAPSLRDLFLKFCGGIVDRRPIRSECVLESTLRYIAFKASAIESLCVYGITQVGSLLPLAACHNLRKLHLYGGMMDAQSFNILAGMANLSDLRIFIDDVEDTPTSLGVGFSKLESLSLRGGQQAILSVLQAISSPLLRSISLNHWDIQGNIGPDHILGPENYRNVMMSLACCTKFAGLRRLIVCMPRYSLSSMKKEASTLVYVIRPLFVMGQLEEVHLQFEWFTMRLPDTDFYELTSAWLE